MEVIDESKVLDSLYGKNRKLFGELLDEVGPYTTNMVAELKLRDSELYQKILEELGFNEQESDR